MNDLQILYLLTKKNIIMKKLSLLISFFILLFACNSNKKEGNKTENNAGISELSNTENNKLEVGTFDISEESFGNVIGLKGREQKLDALINPTGAEMLIKKDFLIIASNTKDKMFNIFSLPDFKLVYSFGVKGGGPNEFVYPLLVQTDEEDKICYIYEQTNEKLYCITVGFKLIKSDIKFPKGKIRESALRQIHVISNKEMLYASAASSGKKIFRFNSDSANSEIEINNLALDKKYNSWAAYEGSFGVNKKKDRMVFAYNYFREIKFLNLDGTKERKLVLDYEKPRSGDAVTMLAPTNMTYYWKIYPCNESVYFTYSGNTPVNWKKLMDKGEEFIYIEQYNWNGVPLHKFKLDHLGYFCVDEKRNKLYLISTVSEEPFYVYDILK